MVAVSSSARSGMHRREFKEKDKKRGGGGAMAARRNSGRRKTREK